MLFAYIDETGTSWGYAKVKLANVCDSLHYVKSKHR